MLGISVLIAAALGGRFLLKNYLLNTYSRTNDQVVGLFDAANLNRALGQTKIVCYRAVFKSTARWTEEGDLSTDLVDHDVLISVEPYVKGTNYKANILKEVISGVFDSQIMELASLIKHSKHQVHIRWQPDMEVPTDVYPWQFKLPGDYINSFNYFAVKLKKYAPNALIIWGPSGYPGDTEYWPGNKNVNYASITLRSESENQTDFYPLDADVSLALRHKLHRLRFINKPVLILATDGKVSGRMDGLLKDEKQYYLQNRSDVYPVTNYVDSTASKPNRTEIKLGVFDPTQKLIGQKSITVEHIFTDWGEVQRGEFKKKFNEIISRKHQPIVTMEPWRDISGKTDTALLKNILGGRYDNLIQKLFNIISSSKTEVYLRWMHEMEIPIHRYAWQSQDPGTYIKAFRYFMQFKGGPGINVKRVWGPAGDRGSVDFWPGSDVVDFISIAIYGLPDKNITDPEKQEAFSTVFNRKYFRMRFLNKPLFITEFGVKGPETFQDKWLADAAKTINANRHVFGVCYFNLYDNPKAWGNIKAPDWSITPRSMSKFSSLLKN